MDQISGEAQDLATEARMATRAKVEAEEGMRRAELDLQAAKVSLMKEEKKKTRRWFVWADFGTPWGHSELSI